MTPAEVAAVVGPARTGRELADFVLEFRPDPPDVVMPKLSFARGRLGEVEFFVEQVGITCDSVAINSNDLEGSIAALLPVERAHGGTVHRGDDVLIFAALGLVMGGVDWDEPTERSLVVFAHHHLEAHLASDRVAALPRSDE